MKIMPLCEFETENGCQIVYLPSTDTDKFHWIENFEVKIKKLLLGWSSFRGHDFKSRLSGSTS